MNRLVHACLIGLALTAPATGHAASANLSAAANKAFLAANAAKPGTVTRPSGLQYRVLHDGVGRHPGPGDWAQVTYSGKFIDGTVFDGTSPGLPATLAVNGIIPGLGEALQLMHAGDRWQIVVPPALAFGPHGSANGAIPPEQALVFDVTLLSVQAPSGPQAPSAGLPLSIATEGREQKAVLTIHP